jgi:monothiol glutaredoxin
MDRPMPAEPRVQHLSATELKTRLDRGERLELVDVRTEFERAVASIEGSQLLNDDVHQRLLALDRDTPLVFVCHHGIRSQAAADYFLGLGFRSVHNLIGGIDAWSEQVDRSVPRY